jgi:hypothetical protein
MHVATQWNNGADAWLRCTCARWESDAGDSMRSQRAAHRAHRVEMGEKPAEPRPSTFDRLKAAEAKLAALAERHRQAYEGSALCRCGLAFPCPNQRIIDDNQEEPCRG